VKCPSRSLSGRLCELWRFGRAIMDSNPKQNDVCASIQIKARLTRSAAY